MLHCAAVVESLIICFFSLSVVTGSQFPKPAAILQQLSSLVFGYIQPMKNRNMQQGWCLWENDKTALQEQPLWATSVQHC